MITPATMATTVAVAVASNSGPASLRRSELLRRSRSRKPDVGDAGREPERGAAAWSSPVRSVLLEHSGDQQHAGRARSAAPRARARFGRSASTAHATSGTSTTCMFASTVARPAPTSSIEWCQRIRSAAKKTPAATAMRRWRPRPPAEPSILEPRQEAEDRQRERAPEDRRRRRRGVTQPDEDARERDRDRAEQRGHAHEPVVREPAIHHVNQASPRPGSERPTDARRASPALERRPRENRRRRARSHP